MTVFGWDASHYDGLLTPSILARAKGEGVGFFTHKIAEGLADTEGTNDDTALGAARSAGIEFVGGYLVPRSSPSVSAQVDRWLQLADAGEGWWRGYPGWFWQVDLERWQYDDVAASVGVEAARQLRDRTGRWTILYASHGQYGDSLSGWDGPLWNAHYTGRAAARIDQMYPGDAWRPVLRPNVLGGWAPYSGREPTILQYTSSATIAGLSTCDANAYRGDIAQLRALIQGQATGATTTRGGRMIVMAHERGSNQDWIGDGVFRYLCPDADHRANALVVMRMQGNPNPKSEEFNPGTLDALGPIVVSAPAGVPTSGGAVGAPSDAQVNAGILAAMQDPGVQAGIGAALAGHFHIT